MVGGMGKAFLGEGRGVVGVEERSREGGREGFWRGGIVRIGGPERDNLKMFCPIPIQPKMYNHLRKY